MNFLKKIAAVVAAGVMALTAISLTASAEEDWRATARPVSNGKEVSVSLSANEKQYYKITVKQAGNLVLDISSTIPRTKINVYNSYGKEYIDGDWSYLGRYRKEYRDGAAGGGDDYVCDSVVNKYEGKSCFEVDKGDYYIRVMADSGSGKVTFTPHFLSTNSVFGNAISANGDKTYTTSLGALGEETVYKFKVSESGTMKINLKQSNIEDSQLTATLYKGSEDNMVEPSSVKATDSDGFENKNSYVYVYNFDDNSGTISYKVTKGTYYFKVAQVRGEKDGVKPEITVKATLPGGDADEGKISCLSLTLSKGSSVQLGAVMAVNGNVKWTSSKSSVVSVSSKGKITAKAKGSAVITAKSGTNSTKIKIIVK